MYFQNPTIFSIRSQFTICSNTNLDVSVVGPDVDVVVLGAVAAVGGGLSLGPDGGLSVLVEGGQVNLLCVLRHVKCEPG